MAVDLPVFELPAIADGQDEAPDALEDGEEAQQAAGLQPPDSDVASDPGSEASVIVLDGFQLNSVDDAGCAELRLALAAVGDAAPERAPWERGCDDPDLDWGGLAASGEPWPWQSLAVRLRTGPGGLVRRTETGPGELLSCEVPGVRLSVSGVDDWPANTDVALPRWAYALAVRGMQSIPQWMVLPLLRDLDASPLPQHQEEAEHFLARDVVATGANPSPKEVARWARVWAERSLSMGQERLLFAFAPAAEWTCKGGQRACHPRRVRQCAALGRRGRLDGGNTHPCFPTHSGAAAAGPE